MSQSYQDIFDVLELIEENKVQKVYKGSKKTAPDQLVIINKFTKSEDFNLAFRELLDNSLQHRLHIEETEKEIILITKLIEGDNLSLFLNFSNSTEEQRIDFVYDYLHQSIAYLAFDNFLINTLIDQNQIVFKDEQLYLKESIIIDRRFDVAMPFSIVSKNIGHAMQRILSTSFRELRISQKHDDLVAFADKLIRRDNEYNCIDDVFSAFKTIYFNNSKEVKTTKEDKIKSNVLMGDMHPNNMIFDDLNDKAFTQKLPVIKDDIPVKKIDPSPKKDIKATTVTHEERAILTGPIEENIDLNKLISGVSSLDDLIVEEPVSYGIPDSLKDKSLKKETKYGIPESLKSEKKFALPDSLKDKSKTKFKAASSDFEEDNDDFDDDDEEENKAFKYKIPLIVSTLAIIALILFLILPKLFAANVDADKRPVAEFEINIENGEFLCTNKSLAFGNKTIAVSYWKVVRNGVKEGESEVREGESGVKYLKDMKVPDFIEGNYEITLLVRDSEGFESDEYVAYKEYISPETKALENQESTEKNVVSDNEEVESDELLDHFDYEQSTNVEDDTLLKNEGSKSLKLNLSENDDSALLSFSDVSIDNKSVISFFITSNEKDKEISIQLIGYKDKENVFSYEINKTPNELLTWMYISSQVDLPDGVVVNKLGISFNSKVNELWFDDLTIKSNE